MPQRPKTACNYKHTQSNGFSLAEVLVTLVIASTGILGMISMQTTALRLNHESYLRATAINQVQTLAEHMRANQLGREQGHYNQLPQQDSPQSSSSCEDCTPKALANYDFTHWNSDNQALLPSGLGTVSGDGRKFTITVLYDRDRTGAKGHNCSSNSDVDLSCVRLSIEL
jgi:type IV pilus assembly protein PilV